MRVDAPGDVAAATVAGHCRLGVAFDGDGDRAILVDGRGHVVDGDAVLLMLALAYQQPDGSAATPSWRP